MTAMFAVFGLGLLLATWMGHDSDDDTDTSESEEPEVDETPEEPEEADTGVSVAEGPDGTVRIELGEDETGSLLMLEHLDIGQGGTGDTQDLSLRLYLVPEGTVLPQSLSEMEAATGEQVNTLEEIEALYGLDLIQTWDLGQTEAGSGDGTPVPDSPVPMPDFGSNAPITFYQSSTSVDGEGVSRFGPDDDADPVEPGSVQVTLGDPVSGGSPSSFYDSDGLVEGGPGDDTIQADPHDPTPVDILPLEGADAITVGLNHSVYDFPSGVYDETEEDQSYVAVSDGDADTITVEVVDLTQATNDIDRTLAVHGGNTLVYEFDEDLAGGELLLIDYTLQTTYDSDTRQGSRMDQSVLAVYLPQGSGFTGDTLDGDVTLQSLKDDYGAIELDSFDIGYFESYVENGSFREGDLRDTFTAPDITANVAITEFVLRDAVTVT